MGKFTVMIDICRFMMTTQRVYRTIITQSCPLLTWKVHRPRVCRTPSKIHFCNICILEVKYLKLKQTLWRDAEFDNGSKVTRTG